MLGIDQLDAGDGYAELDGGDGAVAGGLDRGERADAGNDRLRDAIEPQPHLGDHPERPLGADEQAGEVVAGRGFPRPPRRGDAFAVGRHHGEAQHVLPHGAVANRIGARGAGRRHAAERGIGAGIDRKKQPLIAQMGIERATGDAGFDPAIEIFAIDLENAVHAARDSRLTPPCGAVMCPSSEVPVP